MHLAACARPQTARRAVRWRLRAPIPRWRSSEARRLTRGIFRVIRADQLEPANRTITLPEVLLHVSIRKKNLDLCVKISACQRMPLLFIRHVQISLDLNVLIHLPRKYRLVVSRPPSN